MPKRIQLSRKKGWKMPPNTVSVARPGKWGNPFPVEMLGRDRAVALFADIATGYFNPGKVYDLSDADFVEVYGAKEAWRKRLGRHPLDEIRSELRGKNLACWCKLNEKCHADVLLELANEGDRM